MTLIFNFLTRATLPLQCIKENTLAIARKMKAGGMSAATISEITGLSEEDIEGL